MRSRVVVVIASLLLLATFFFPLWQIGLKAPQYPEGLSLQIWSNKVTGDVRNINVLNHYIGMAKVEPAKIPELAWFPYAFGGLAALGLLAAAWNRKAILRIWAAAVLLFALCGLYDFYRWEYRFGNELSDDAPMKLEDSYQPPLLGTKQILNITATSLPDKAGYAFSLSALLAFGVLLGSLKKKVETPLRVSPSSGSC